MDFPEITVLMQNQYVQALIIVVLFFVIGKVFVFFSEKILLRLAKKTQTQVDDLIVEKTNKPISVLLLVIGLRLALHKLAFGSVAGIDVDKLANSLAETLIAIVVAFIVMRIVSIIINEWGMKFASQTKSNFDDQLVALFQRFSKVVIGIVAFLFILTLWGIKVGPLLASLGIAGIAIAFALQSTLSNVFGGVSLILDRSVQVGDQIKLDADTFGTVTDVGLRSTKIRTFNNEVIIIPNGKLVDSRIQNYVLPDSTLRIVVKFGVAYGSDINKVKATVLGEMGKMEEALKEPSPMVLFMEMADFSLNFQAFFWISDYNDRMILKEKATCNIYNALNREGIEIPFPTRTVYMRQA